MGQGQPVRFGLQTLFGFIMILGALNFFGHLHEKGFLEVQGRVRTLPLSESSREDVISSISDFLRPNTMYQVLKRQRMK